MGTKSPTKLPSNPQSRVFAFVGSRAHKWPLPDAVARVQTEINLTFLLLPNGSRVVSGGATGPDSWAVKVAQQLGIPYNEIAPDYPRYGPKKAPILRDKQIVEEADEVIAFWNGVVQNSGTYATMCMALAANKPLHVWHVDEGWITFDPAAYEDNAHRSEKERDREMARNKVAQDSPSFLGTDEGIPAVVQYDGPSLAEPAPTLYSRLSAPFDETFKDNRGGVELEYITGEQVVSRLNEVLGVTGWEFKVLDHGVHAEADEAWALGELAITEEGFPRVVRQQFGSQKIKRSRASGTPLDIGFDFKGAATDALKKCAAAIGVGLYLSKKNPQVHETRPAAGAQSAQAQGPASAGGDDLLQCEQCGESLQETRFRDGTVWAPSQLAGYGKRKHGRTLCMTDYRAANDNRKRAEAASGDVPF